MSAGSATSFPQSYTIHACCICQCPYVTSASTSFRTQQELHKTERLRKTNKHCYQEAARSLSWDSLKAQTKPTEPPDTPSAELSLTLAFKYRKNRGNVRERPFVWQFWDRQKELRSSSSHLSHTPDWYVRLRFLSELMTYQSSTISMFAHMLRVNSGSRISTLEGVDCLSLE